MPGAPTGPRTENRACLRKVHFWRVLTSKPSDWFYTSWDSLLSQETLSEPFWSDSHIILFSSKHTFFICILLKSSYNKNRYNIKYMFFISHTPISGAKPALLRTVPDLVRSIKTPLEDFTSHRVFMPNMATYVKQWKRKSRSFANSFYLSTVEPAKHTPQPDSHQKSWSFANSFSKRWSSHSPPTPSHWK